MTETAYPFDSQTISETNWSYMARVWGGTGVIGYAGDAAAEVFADASGLQVKVKAGDAQVQGYHWHSDATVTKSIISNSSGNPRIDRVVLKLDPTANTLTLAVVEGTPGATPSAPALTQTDTGVYEMPLAQVRVETGAASIAADKVTNERVHLRRPGEPPAGTVVAWAGGSTPPDGWKNADGTAVSRAAFPALFAAIGTAWGIGDGSSTFNLPNLKGRTPVGVDASQSEFNAVGKVGGAKAVTLTVTEIPAHSHAAHAQLLRGGAAGSYGAATSAAFRGIAWSGGLVSGNTGGGQPHNNLQPYVAINYIVKT